MMERRELFDAEKSQNLVDKIKKSRGGIGRRELSQALLKEVNGDIQALRKLSIQLSTYADLLILLEAVAILLGLPLVQLGAILNRTARSSNSSHKLRNEIRKLLTLEERSPRLAQELARERHILFPQDYPRLALESALTFDPKKTRECDLWIKFPWAVAAEQDLRENEERNGGLIDHSKTWKTLPPSSGDFERRGAELPLGVVELHQPDEVEEALKDYEGKVRTLILDGHGDGAVLTLFDNGKDSWELSAAEFSTPWAAHLFEVLHPTRGKTVLFSCHQGVEGGLGEQISGHTGLRTYASPMAMSGLTIDRAASHKPFVQFWHLGGRRQSTIPLETRIFRPH